MQTEKSRKMVLDYYAAVGAGDTATLDKLLTEGVEWIPRSSTPLDGPFRGRANVLEGMAHAGARFFDLETGSLTTRKIIAEGDTVVVLQDFACKAINGRDYSNEYVWVFTCSDQGIVRMEEHTDTLRFQRIVMDD